MSAEVVYALTGAKKNGAPVEGVRRAVLTASTKFLIDPGSNKSLYDVGAVVTYRELAVELHGPKDIQMKALIGSAPDEVELDFLGLSGPEALFVAGVDFVEEAGQMEAPRADSQGRVPMTAVRGRVEFGDGVAFADVIGTETFEE